MHRVTYLFVAVVNLVIVCHGYSIERIVGGSDALENAYPYQVSLRFGKSHFCGGSILNGRTILTAAHCVVGQNANWITVVAGTNHLSHGGVFHGAETLIPHPNYDPSKISDDIALIHLNSTLIYSSKVQPVDMPVNSSSQIDDENSSVLLTGWGRTGMKIPITDTYRQFPWTQTLLRDDVTVYRKDPKCAFDLRVGTVDCDVITEENLSLGKISYPGNIPNDLQVICLRMITVESCRTLFPFTSLSITNKNVCTLTEEGEGACHGDSGGPLATADGTQVGIVSFGMPCARGYPDVFTRVESYIDWIKEHIKEE